MSLTDLHVNVKRANRGGVALRKFKRATIGYLSESTLAGVLPPKDLLFVSICGTSAFSRQISDQYVEMGLPRGLVSVV